MSSILVTGAAGLLGAHVMTLFSRHHDVVGCDQHPWWGDRPARMLDGDLSAPGCITEIVAAVKPDIVIHCAAMVDVDVAEQNPVRAFACNAQLSGEIARAVPSHCLLVYISTDSVFNGEAPHASEDDPPAPSTVYAQSKLEGERCVQEAARHHLIVRTNFYGWSSGRKRTFVEWLYQALETGTPTRLFTDVWFTPIYVVDFVRRLRVLIERGQRGLIHVGGGERISKYEFGALLARLANFSTDCIIPSGVEPAGLAAPRPKDMSLDSKRFEQISGVSSPRCAEGLRRFLRDCERSLSRRFDERSDGPLGDAEAPVDSARILS